MTVAPESTPAARAGSSFIETLAVYLKPRVLIVLFLGFSAGLPLALSGSTLLVWMRESGVDLGTIGLFALVGTPYTIKFRGRLLIDALDAPILSRLLGRRRGWLVLSQLLLMASIVLLAFSDPAGSPAIARCALLVAAASATQDIVIDAFRVESLDPRRTGRRHGLLCRRLPYWHAGLDCGRALSRQRFRRLRDFRNPPPGRQATSPWRCWW